MLTLFVEHGRDTPLEAGRDSMTMGTTMAGIPAPRCLMASYPHSRPRRVSQRERGAAWPLGVIPGAC